ncbi:MAG: methyltransferase domain-containing protein [Actinobacteria bacterium]|nr:methyltransferase domain-containing protein [Actinomycetota bacterium]
MSGGPDAFADGGRRPAWSAACVREETVRVGDVELSLLRPAEPDQLLDETAFGPDEFLPYWAELWPAGLALARALPEDLAGLRVIELGCGLGIPSLLAAARGADVTAVDWAADAVSLLHTNAAANGLAVDARVRDWRDLTPPAKPYDLALAADVLYEERNVEPLALILPKLAPTALVALAGRPHEDAFVARVGGEPVAERIVRIGQPMT